MDLTIKKIDKINPSVINDWNKLWNIAVNSSVFNSYLWFKSSCDTLKITDFQLIACYKDNEMLAILPLIGYKKFAVSVFSTPNNHFLVDTGILCKSYDEQLLKTFFDYLMNNYNFYLTKFDSDIAGILKKIFPKLFFSLMSANPYLNLDDNYVSRLSKRTISSAKKLMNSYPDKIKFEYLSSERLTNDLIETLFTIDEKSAKKLKNKDIFSNETNKNFFRNLYKYCHKFIKIFVFYFNEVPVAYHFGFLYKNFFAAYHTSYLAEYRFLEPGKTSMVKLIEKLHAEKIGILDFGGGMSDYKKSFADSHRLLYDLYFSKNSLTMAWWRLINLVRRLKQKTFPEKHTEDYKYLFKEYQNENN